MSDVKKLARKACAEIHQAWCDKGFACNTCEIISAALTEHGREMQATLAERDARIARQAAALKLAEEMLAWNKSSFGPMWSRFRRDETEAALSAVREALK